jgi:serine phosphatase RsbU (regulator of sigma subunit)
MIRDARKPKEPEPGPLTQWTERLLAADDLPANLRSFALSCRPLLADIFRPDRMAFLSSGVSGDPASITHLSFDSDRAFGPRQPRFSKPETEPASAPDRVLSIRLFFEGAEIGRFLLERDDASFAPKDLETAAEFERIASRLFPPRPAPAETCPEAVRAAQFRRIIQELGRALQAGVDVEETLQTVVDLAAQIVGARSAVIRLLEGDRFVARAVTGEEAQILRSVSFAWGEGIVGRAAERKRIVLLNRFDPADLFAPADQPYAEAMRNAGIRKLICVPIFSEENQRVIGTLTVYNKHDGDDFFEEEGETLSTFAHHAAAAVERAALREQQDLALEEANILHDFTHIAASLNLSWIISNFIEKVCEVARVPRCSLLLYHPQRNALLLEAERGMERGEDAEVWKTFLPLCPADALYERLLEGGAVYLPRDLPYAPREHWERLLNAQRFTLLPLVNRRRLAGVVAMVSDEETVSLSERQRRILTSVARQIAAALENARLFEEAERRVQELSSLQRISQGISSNLQKKEMLETVLAEVVFVMGADSGSIMLYDPVAGQLCIEAAHGLPGKVARKAALALGEGVAGWVAAHREALLTDNLSGDPRFNLVARRPEIASAIIAPILYKHRLLGALSISSNVRRFNERDLNLVKTMAASIAVAIENARHYEEERQIAQIARATLLPQVQLKIPGLDIGEKHVPSHEVGGDCYHLFPLCDGKVGVLVSDVSGKSIPAAMHAIMGKHFIRALSHRCESPAEALSHANTLIARDTPPEIFISVFYGVLDVRSGELTYCNAGHVPPLVARVNHSSDELTETGMVIGLWEEMPYENARSVLQPGETLLCYTDGVTEAKREAELFGYDRLKSALLKHSHESAQKIVDSIYRRTLAFCGKKTDDDLALFAIKRTL